MVLHEATFRKHSAHRTEQDHCLKLKCYTELHVDDVSDDGILLSPSVFLVMEIMASGGSISLASTEH